MQKLAIKIIVGLLVLFIGLVFFHLFAIPYLVTSDIEKIKCNGIVTSIKETSPCFFTVVIRQKDSDLSIQLNHCCSDKSFFDFAAVGDSIRKDPGELKLTITKFQNSSKKRFNYPFCFQ
jgi:hypothetical protein